MRIYSDHVNEETRSYYTVRFPEDAPQHVKDGLRKELEVYRRYHYGDAAETIPVETRVELVGEEKWIVLSVAGSTMTTGFAWNPAVYDDIVHAVDLVEE